MDEIGCIDCVKIFIMKYPHLFPELNGIMMRFFFAAFFDVKYPFSIELQFQSHQKIVLRMQVNRLSDIPEYIEYYSSECIGHDRADEVMARF